MILYSKFNTERKSCFQLVTKIVKSKNYIYSTKSSCNPKSQIFLNSFFEKYKYLKNHNFSFIPLKPKKVSNSEISFSYQKYPSLEQLLFLSFQNNDKKTFISLIKKYLNTIKHNRLTNNILSPKFKNIFGDLHPKLTQNIFCIGCIDINFNNIFYDVKKKKYLLIDYEWTFIDVYIPYKYLFFRAISSFYANYFSYNLNIFIPLNTFYKLARITQNEQDMFIKFEYNLQHYVYGDKFLKNNKFDDFYQVYLQLKTLKKNFRPSQNTFESVTKIEPHLNNQIVNKNEIIKQNILYRNQITQLEKQLNDFTNSNFYRLWSMYNRIKIKPKNEKQK